MIKILVNNCVISEQLPFIKYTEKEKLTNKAVLILDEIESERMKQIW